MAPERNPELSISQSICSRRIVLIIQYRTHFKFTFCLIIFGPRKSPYKMAEPEVWSLLHLTHSQSAVTGKYKPVHIINYYSKLLGGINTCLKLRKDLKLKKKVYICFSSNWLSKR